MMSVKNNTTVNAHVFNASNYHQSDFFVRIKQIQVRESPLRDASTSHVTSFRILFHMYGFDYSHCTLSVTFHHQTSAENMNTSATCGMTVGRKVLNNGTIVLLLNRSHRPEAI